MFNGASGFSKRIVSLAGLSVLFFLGLGCGKSQEKAAEKEVRKISKPVFAKNHKLEVKVESKRSAQDLKAALEKQKLIETVNRDPKAWKERYLLGGIHLRENDVALARKRFLEVIKLKPDFIKGYSALAMCSMRLNELDKALEYWKLVRKRDPKNRSARDFIYRIQKKIEVDREIGAMVEKVEQRRADWQVKKRLGEKFLSLRRFSEAADMFEQALKSNPRDADLNYQLAKAFLNIRQYMKASRFFSRASSLAPGNGQYALMARRIKEVLANLRKRKKKEDSSEITKPGSLSDPGNRSERVGK